LTASDFVVGRAIVEHEQKGAKRAAYGEQLLELLSVDLSTRFGRGFSQENLRLICLFYEEYRAEISKTLSGKSDLAGLAARFQPECSESDLEEALSLLRDRSDRRRRRAEASARSTTSDHRGRRSRAGVALPLRACGRTRGDAMRGMRAKSWSPYAVGVGIGVLSWFAFATAGHGLGITTSFESAMAVIVGAVDPAAKASNSYFADHSPKVDWEWMVVVGVLLGSFLSSKLSGDRQHAVVPPLWRERFGGSVTLRLALAFVGGTVMMLGARLARGCTSGHGITGVLQLAVSSWIFIGLAFSSAIVVALSIFGRPRTTGGE
jgi:uncharacterized membrane protein YedE/YeeE